MEDVAGARNALYQEVQMKVMAIEKLTAQQKLLEARAKNMKAEVIPVITLKPRQKVDQLSPDLRMVIGKEMVVMVKLMKRMVQILERDRRWVGWLVVVCCWTLCLVFVCLTGMFENYELKYLDI